MKRIKVCNVLLLTIVVLYGCIDDKKNVKKTINENFIDLNFDIEDSKSFNYSTLVDSQYTIVPLETNDKCLISEVTKLDFRNSRFFILDYYAKSIFIFDKSGNFLDKVFSVGLGPGEYLEITNMTVSDSMIIVIDNRSGKQICYSYTGDFIKESRLYNKIWARDLFNFNDRIYYKDQWGHSKMGYYRLYSAKVNSLEDFSAYLEYNSEDEPLSLGMEGKSYALCSKNGSIAYSGCDTIFNITLDGEIMPKYCIDFNGNRATYSSGNVGNVFTENSEDKILNIEHLCESDRYIFIHVSTIGGYYILLYDKIEQCSLLFPGVAVNENWGQLQCDFKWCIENYLIQVFPMDFLKAEWEINYSRNSFSSHTIKDSIENIVRTRNISDNPVLFLFRLREKL